MTQRSRLVHRRGQHGELVLAEVSHDVACAPHRRGDRPPHLSQHVVGRAAAEHLAVGGAGVDVEAHDGDRSPVTLRDRPVPPEHLQEMLGSRQAARAVQRCRVRAGRTPRHGPVEERDLAPLQQLRPALAVDAAAVAGAEHHAHAHACAGQRRIGRSLGFDLVDAPSGEPVLWQSEQRGQRRIDVGEAGRAVAALGDRDTVRGLLQQLSQDAGINRGHAQFPARYASSCSLGASIQ